MGHEVNACIPEVEFVIGDVRDAERLSNVVAGVDYIVHAAATRLCQRQNIIHQSALKQT